MYFQEKFKIKANEKINLPQCQEPNKTECVFLKNNYNSIDLTEVEQIDEIVEERFDVIFHSFFTDLL